MYRIGYHNQPSRIHILHILVFFTFIYSMFLFKLAIQLFLCFLTLISRISRLRRSQWLRGLMRRSVAARLLRLWVRIPPGGMDVRLL